MFRFHFAAAAFAMILPALPPGAAAASFDCGKAVKPDEVTICKTPELSALDSEMSGLWFAFRKVPMLMGSSGARMDDAQDFLTQRAACGGDVACLRKVYHDRIAALKDGIVRAMDDVSQRENAEPVIEPWSVASLPEPLQEAAGAFGEQCRKLGGTLKEGSDMPALMTGDLDGDGMQDVVFDPQPLDCSGAATAFCGNGGCQIKVALSGDRYAEPVEILGGVPTLVLAQDGPSLDVWVDRTNCNFSGRDKACWATYRWPKSGAPKVTYTLRALPQ
ncbi:lysozyme inhibitor LprI family protein [Nordella sp. HKS 07]|uniref:lysozyme inhibitor LprI family protein n=1 Tax=Nordella sp. HKS 07 TaxID=2712222 RepID=UPI0019D230A0|nr:hypothetical protein [Nordella sp. HKS 07]